MLIYETQDPAFAASVIDALERAGIDCYRTGGLIAEVPYSDSTICIHIRDAADRLNANEILIKLGAVTDDTDRFPPKWVFVVLAFVAVALAFWITSEWK